MKKTDEVRGAIERGDWKAALRIARVFRINVTKEQRSTMSRAYECILYPEFYRQLGINVQLAIQAGQETVTSIVNIA